MKKLTLMVLFIGFFSNASSTCNIDIKPDKFSETISFIIENCKNDDILVATSRERLLADKATILTVVTSGYCRFDREIIFKQIDKEMLLSCVLNSTMPRPVKLQDS